MENQDEIDSFYKIIPKCIINYIKLDVVTVLFYERRSDPATADAHYAFLTSFHTLSIAARYKQLMLVSCAVGLS